MDKFALPSSADTASSASVAPQLSCPSAPSDWPEAKIFGVVSGTSEAPRVAYLDETIAMSPEWVQRTAPVDAGEVLRITAPCAAERCQHFSKDHCQLVNRTLHYMEPVVDRPPVCAIRNACRWWNEHGKQACVRCPQVVTLMFPRDPTVILAATPAPKPD